MADAEISPSKAPDDTSGQQDDAASKTGSVHEEKQKPASESHKDWFSRVTKGGQEVLWPPVGSGQCPTLLTGVQPSDLKSLETFRWEDKLETADLEKHTSSNMLGQGQAIPTGTWPHP